MNKETIEILEEVQSSVEYYERDKPEFLEALSTAIQALKALDQAEKELGGKKAPFKCCKCGFEGWTSSHDVCLKCGEAVYRVSLENEGYNRMHDIAQPIIAQRDLRISELMKSEYQARANYGDLFSDFKQDEQELQTLYKPKPNYHQLGKEIADLVKDPDAMKAISLEKNLRKLGYVKISNTPIEEHIQIDLEQYAKENGYVKKESTNDK